MSESSAVPAARAAARREGDVRRAVVLAHESLNADSRAARFARSLGAAGWETTLVGAAEKGLPAEERLPPADRPPQDDPAKEDPAATARDVRLLRLPPTGSLAGFLRGSTVRRGPLQRVPGIGAVARRLGWPLAARAWGESLRYLPPADLYHACGLGAGLVALDLARRARRHGRAGRVIYDYIDILQDSDIRDRYPLWRRLYPRVEASIVRSAASLTTVSGEHAADAKARWKLARSPLVVDDSPPTADAWEAAIPRYLRVALELVERRPTAR